ncbi:hypothetical protein MPNTM1_04432 [Mycolicibacterium parafortuitum]|uniref:Ig-like domain-containing protein n=1 Tax=Mycolicibacterium parafortuitum TaxID=39692 RepID=UPI0032C4A0BB
MGLAAAIISGQGVASAGADDGSASGDSSATPPGKRNAAADRPVAGSGQSDSPPSSSDESGTGTESDSGAGNGTGPIGTDTDVEDSDVEDTEQDSALEPDEEIDEETSSEATAAGAETSLAPQKPSAAERSTLSTGGGAPAQEDGTTARETDPSAPAPGGGSADPGSAPAPNAPSGSTGTPATAAPNDDAATPDAAETEAASLINVVKQLVKAFSAAPIPGDDSAPPISLDQVLQGMWLGSRQSQTTRKAVAEYVELVSERALAQLATSIGWVPFVGTGLYAASFVGNLGALTIAVLRGDSADIADEFRDLARDVIGMVPVVGAPTAAKLYAADSSSGGSAQMAEVAAAATPTAMTAAATAVPGTAEWYFIGVLQRAVKRLAGWPGPAGQNFVDITNRVTDQTLDNSNNQLDVLIANAFAGSPAVWLPDLGKVLGLFVLSAIPGYSYTDSLNAWGSFLNKIMPPFKIADGAGTLDVISNYKIMGAAVVGAATLLRDMLNGIYDPVQWEINIIKTTTGATVTASDLNNFNSLSSKVVAAQAGAVLGIGDGGAFDEPERAWNVTFPTWTAEQVNPYTILTYTAFVGLYKRFQEMATLTTFTTWTTYDSWHYTNGLGMYAAGTFHAVDPDGGSIEFRADGTLGRTYTTEGNALVTINTTGGGFTYTPPAIWDPKFQNAAFFHRSTAEDPEERFDWVTVQAYSADGVPYNIRVGIEIINGTNANPTGAPTNQGADAAGVVKGKINGSDADGDALKYSLVGSSVNGLNGNSAYTKNGSGNGGIVSINPTTGDFTYVSSATAGATQSFQVLINDGHYGNTVVTVTVPNTTSINPANVNTSTQNVVTGTPPASPNKPGVFVSYTLGTTPTKGTVTSFNPATGAFTYTRNAALGHSTSPNDFVTVIATDVDGRQVTLRMAVAPSVPNTAPVANVTTAPTVGSLSGTVQTSSGKITATDADGDSLTYTASGLASGASVTFQSDGTFTYVTNIATSARHAAAKVGATAAQKNQSFTVTVSDGFGGNTNVVVSVPIYAVNGVPVITSGGQFLGTVGVIKAEDPDGDSISTTRNPTAGNSGYTLSNGGSLTSGSLSLGTATLTFPSGGWPVTIRVYDGYYFVVNGVVTGNLAYGEKVLG